MQNNQEVVFFDVDDTLIKGQSQKLFINFIWKRGVVSLWFYVRLMIWFFLYKLHIIKDPKKVAVHAFSFLKKMSRRELVEMVNLFFEQVLVKEFYQDAVLLIKEHQKKGRKIFLVSNAFDSLIAKITQHVGADGYIATELKEEDGILSGKIDGTINYGEAKANRVMKFCKEENISLEKSWGYSDHPSDVWFLNLMKNPSLVNPSKNLQKKLKGFRFNIVVFKR